MGVKATVAAIAALIFSTAAHSDDLGAGTKSFAGWSQEELNEKWGMDVRYTYHNHDLAGLTQVSGASPASRHLLICITNDVCSIQKWNTTSLSLGRHLIQQ